MNEGKTIFELEEVKPERTDYFLIQPQTEEESKKTTVGQVIDAVKAEMIQVSKSDIDRLFN